MNNTGALILINNREALPVRAIPYYSAWRLTPDILANEFSSGDIALCSWIRHIPTYHMVNDGPVKILPLEWKDSDVALKSLTVKLKSEFENDDQGYEAWRTNSITKLPAGAFVWLDDFLNSYSENNIESSDLTASTITQENQFTSHPIILKDSTISKLVFEGFESYSSATCNNVDASLASATSELEAPNEHRKTDAQPKHTITTNNISNSRSDILTAVINLAREKAVDSRDVSSVWAYLVALCSGEKPPPPLISHAGDEGIKYSEDGEIKFFTKKNLTDRMRRAKNPN